MKKTIESYTAEEKLELYKLAVYLFDSGKSHPQIVAILEQENNSSLSLIITDKAFKEVWHKLYEHAALLLFRKRSWNEVVDKLKKNEPFPDVVELLVNEIYLRDTDMFYAEAEFGKKFEIWGYLIIMGIIQLVRYLIWPYNKIYFWISMMVGVTGLLWGIWEFFFNNKNDKIFARYFEQLTITSL